MSLSIILTNRFKRDYKRAEKRGLKMDCLDAVIRLLASGETLPETLRDHSLTGDYSDFRECHIAPDWLLIYKIDGHHLILMLSRTGSHSDLFG